MRIEIQIRSRLQHAWATAVETVDTFTRQAIKTGGGNAEWRRFFLLMGSAIAIMERRPVCPECPTDVVALRTELKNDVHKLNVRAVLRGWSKAMTVIPSTTTKDAAFYLMYLDATEGSEAVKVTGFTSHREAKASEAYLSTERMIKDKPNMQAVLVSANSVHALRSAFPNYFADTEVFIDAINQAVVLKAGGRTCFFVGLDAANTFRSPAVNCANRAFRFISAEIAYVRRVFVARGFFRQPCG